MEFKAIRGVEDIIPPKSKKFEKVESVFKSRVLTYGFKPVWLPIIEFSELFERSVGETSDIVQKEMYVFEDRSGRRIALRPEGTASAVRAYIEHTVFSKEPYTKWFYIGPMFRYERPQAGRKRQFYQAGCEVFGLKEPGADAELIKLASDILSDLGIEAVLEINSIGCKNCRPKYKEALISYLSSERNRLCKDCILRMERNPLRTLDCKVESCRDVVKEAPKISDFLCEECKSHFEGLKNYLKELGVDFTFNPDIVRGLDYYTKTVFEFKSKSLGSQSTVLAGGRYDDLIEELGGPSIPALGFALGIDRVVLLLEEEEEERKRVFIAYQGEEAYLKSLELAFFLRERGIECEVDHRKGSFKSQFKLANKLNVKYVVVIGEEEVREGFYSLKCMESGKQERVDSLESLLARI